MTRRVHYAWDDPRNEIELPDRPVCLVKDWATEMFGDWTTNWADPGFRTEEKKSDGGTNDTPSPR